MTTVSKEDCYKVVADSYNKNTYYEDYRQKRELTLTEVALLHHVLLTVQAGNNTVVDIGCGDGQLYDKYLSDCGCKVRGFDISSKQIERAKQNVPSASYTCANFMDVPYKEHTEIDAIICMYALFNFDEDDQKEIMRRAYYMLRSGGIFLLNVRKEIHEEVKYAESWCGQPMYWYLPGVQKVIDWAISAGFSCRVTNNSDNPDYVFLLLEK